jgi:hypothetical protein
MFDKRNGNMETTRKHIPSGISLSKEEKEENQSLKTVRQIN